MLKTLDIFLETTFFSQHSLYFPLLFPELLQSSFLNFLLFTNRLTWPCYYWGMSAVSLPGACLMFTFVSMISVLSTAYRTPQTIIQSYNFAYIHIWKVLGCCTTFLVISDFFSDLNALYSIHSKKCLLLSFKLYFWKKNPNKITFLTTSASTASWGYEVGSKVMKNEITYCWSLPMNMSATRLWLREIFQAQVSSRFQADIYNNCNAALPLSKTLLRLWPIHSFRATYYHIF